MFDRIVHTSLLLLAATGAFSSPGLTQAYPTQPVKIIVQSPPGGGPDTVARLVAEQLGRLWKQQVQVLNRPGGGGIIALQAAAAAPADGSTLYMPNSSTMLVLPVTHAPLPVDLEKAFTSIGIVAIGPMVLAVTPRSGIGSVADLIARAKAEPDKMFYTAIAPGTLPHITSLLFLRHAGVRMTYVPYQSTPQVLQEIMGGRQDIAFDGMGALLRAIDGGTLKPLGITSEKRIATRPDVPTIAETLPGYRVDSWYPLLAPNGTAPWIIERAATTLREALGDKDIQERFKYTGQETRHMSSTETAAFIRTERARWEPLIGKIKGEITGGAK